MDKIDRPGAAKRIRSRFGSVQCAWEKLAEVGLERMEPDAARRESLKLDFVQIGSGAADKYRPQPGRFVAGLAANWIEFLVLAVSGLLLLAPVDPDRFNEPRVVTTSSISAFALVDAPSLRADSVRVALGGFESVWEVDGRVALRPIEAGHLLLPGDLSDYTLDGQQRDRIAARTVLSVPISGYFPGSLQAGSAVDIVAIYAPPSPPDSTKPVCKVFRDVFVFTFEAGAGTADAVVAVGQTDVVTFAEVLRRTGSSFRVVVGDGC